MRNKIIKFIVSVLGIILFIIGIVLLEYREVIFRYDFDPLFISIILVILGSVLLLSSFSLSLR